MKRFLAVVVAAVGLVSAPAFAVSDPGPIFSLYAKLEDGSRVFFCSGALVQAKAGAVGLTADHCLNDLKDGKNPDGFKVPVFASFDDGDTFVRVAHLRAGDAAGGFDAYLIRPYSGYKWPAVKPLNPAKADLKAGDYLETWGFPAGAGLTFTKGYVRLAKIERPWTGNEIRWSGYVGADLNISGGASGSAVLNEQGEVVGVLCGTFSDSRGFQLTVYLPVSKIASWLF